MRLFYLLIPLCFLCACSVTVEDFGGYWDRGAIDSALTGRWIDGESGKEVIAITREANRYRISEIKEDTPPDRQPAALDMRVLYVNAYTFFMLRDSSDNANINTLIRYESAGNELRLFKPNPDRRRAFLREYPHSGIRIEPRNLDYLQGQEPVHGEEPYRVRIPKLTPQVIKTLQSLAGKPDYWIAGPPLTRASH